MTRLQRRLYGIYTIYGLFFTIPLNCFFVLFYCFPIFFSLLNASFEEKIHTYSIHPFIYPSIYLSMYLSTIFSRKKTFLFFSTCLSIFLCMCLCLSFYLSMSIVYLSIYLSRGQSAYALHWNFTGRDRVRFFYSQVTDLLAILCPGQFISCTIDFLSNRFPD